MGEILKIGHFLSRKPPQVKVEGYRLVQYGKPCLCKPFYDLDLAIQAAQFRAAETAGISSLFNTNDLLPKQVMDAHTGKVGIERVEKCGDTYHYVGIAYVTYTLGTYLPQVQMLPETPTLTARSQAPLA